MRKTVNLALMIFGALAVISVFHYFNWVMNEWTRPLILFPLIYAGVNFRRAGSISTLVVLFLGQAPAFLFTYHNSLSSGMNFLVAAVTLGVVGVYVGHVMRREKEARVVWEQAREVRQSVRENVDTERLFSLLIKLFGERGQSRCVDVYLFDEENRLRKHNDPNADPLESDHFFHEVARRDEFFVSVSVADDPRLEYSGKKEAPEDISRIAAFPIRYGGVVRGVITIINSESEHFDNETVALLTSVKQSVERSLELLDKRRVTIQHKLRHDRIRDTFSSYVSRAVAEEILKDPDKIDLGGKQQDVTVMFTEVVNFRELQNTETPSELISMLNEYFSTAIDSVFEFDGTLDKFIGDNIMAFWGAPLPQPDSEKRAIHCALKLQECINMLNNDWEKRGKNTFKVCIGINSGKVVAGNIGSIRRMEYTVIGDTVNLAARIKTLSKTKNVPILVSQSAFDKVSSLFSFSDKIKTTVKGKSQEVAVYQLLSEPAD